MATYYGHPPASSSASTAPGDAPIRMQGFPLPGLPTPQLAQSPPGSLPQNAQALAALAHLYPGHPFHLPPPHHPGQGLGASGIDPAVLLGCTAAAPQPLPHAGQHAPFGSLGTYGTAGSSVLSDADLDFESVLASLGAAAHQHQQHAQGQGQGQYGGNDAAQAQADLFAAGGMFDPAGMHPPPPQRQQGQAHPQLSPHLQLDHIPSYFAQHGQQQQRHAPQQQPQQDTFPSPAARPSKSSERGTSSKRAVSTERTGRTGRTATTGTGSVGKAPRQSRSRSARRSSSAAGYDRDRPSPGSRDSGGRRGAEEAGAEPSPVATPGASHSNGAVGIPSTGGVDHAQHAQAHPYAMSLPGYSSSSLSGTPSSLPAHSGAWGAIAAAHAHAFAAHPFPGTQAQSQGTSQGIAMPGAHGGGGDAATGWRPSPPGGSAAASAPPGTGLSGRSPTAGGGVKVQHGGKKGKGLADVQEEDDGKGDVLSEKRRKRRESHNAVERRRRDNINDRITELSLLVPETFLTASSPPDTTTGLPPVDEGPASPAIGALSLRSPGPSSAAVLSGSPASAPGAGFAGKGAKGETLTAQQLAAKEKPNKGVVLAKSVEYIKYLQQMVELQQQQAVELQRQNAVLREALSYAPGPSHAHAHEQAHLPYLPPQPPSFPASTAASSFSPSHASSPASPHAHAAGGAGGASALGLALDSPGAASATASSAFFDFGADDRRGDGGSGAGGAGGGDAAGAGEDTDGRPQAQPGRCARAGERAWTPMLEGIEGMRALKEEDMDES